MALAGAIALTAPVSTSAVIAKSHIEIICKNSSTIVCTQQTISDFGHRAAENFLSQFTTIFSGVGLRRQDGQFVDVGFGCDGTRREILLYETPYIFWDEASNRFYDQFENFIAGRFFYDGTFLKYENTQDFPWFYGGIWFANDFSLYDFDGSGIPQIVIYFGTMAGADGLSPIHLFRFVDGEYRKGVL